MKRWAKVVEVEGTQVLFYHEYLSVEDEYCVHQIIKNPSGVQADIKMIRKDREFTQEEFDKGATEEQAKKVIKLFKDMT